VWAGLYGPLWCVLPSEGSVSVHSPTECPRPCCEVLRRAMTSRFDTQCITVVNARTRSSIHRGCLVDPLPLWSACMNERSLRTWVEVRPRTPYSHGCRKGRPGRQGLGHSVPLGTDTEALTFLHQLNSETA